MRSSLRRVDGGVRPGPGGVGSRLGFTIVEMLVVLAMIILLASILIVALSKAAGTGQQASTTFLINSISSGLAQFKGDHGYVPPVLGDNGTPDTYPGWSRDGIAPNAGWDVENATDLANMQQWYSVTTLAEYLLGYGSRDEDGYGVIGSVTSANTPGRNESPALGIRSPGQDGLWGAVYNPRPNSFGPLGGYLYRNPGNSGTGVPMPDGNVGNNDVKIDGRIFGPYLELKNPRLLGGLGTDGSVVGPDDPDYANRPKVVLDYWGDPIRYYRRPYSNGDPAVNVKGLNLGDIFALRPWNIKTDLESNGAADGRGDTSTTPQLKSADFGLLSGGPDRSINSNARYDENESNRDNVVGVGP
ncbi:MAG: type II secretion system GspH family protein [Phycisphaerales bacterium]|nr:type II secretion system GspH family protein [Phycisphaerales bacterium]